MSSPTIHYLGPAPRREATAAPAVRLASMVILIASILTIWWPTLGLRAVWFLPPAALGLALAANRVPVPPVWRPWIVALGWLLWTPLVMVLTNQPITTALPRSLGTGVVDFFQSPGAPAGAAQFAVWLTAATGVWLMGCDMAARPGRGSVAFAFFALALPFAVAIPLLSHSGGAAWEGGAVLVAALLWATRGDLRGSLPALAAVGVVAALTSMIVGPHDKWSSLDRARSAASGSFGRGNSPQGSNGGSTLNTDQTYGPIKNDFTGGTMLEVESNRPAFWRMQTLSEFNGRGWALGSTAGDDLPQPNAIGTKIGVRVDGLRDDRVVSPGRVLGVSGGGATKRTAGETVELESTPSSGKRYSVTAQFVQASLDAIGSQQIPTGEQYAPFTTVFPNRDDIPTPVTSIANRLTPAFAATEMGQTILIAKQLSVADSELGVVQNVERFLGDSKFRYSLDAPPAGNSPVLDFITKTHVGYCQHFAGAAALLLRLAGVPTRVAVGFATGEQTTPGVYTVADKDAHAWIEVYFEGVGWVPFNPTPPGAAASIAAGVDVTHPDGSGSDAQQQRPAGTIGDGSTIGLVLIAVLALGCIYAWRRARRGQPIPALGDVLVRLVPPPAGAATTHLEIRHELAKLGPSLDALGEEAERQRFGVPGAPAERHPHRRVWRALVRDVGLPRAVRLKLFGAPRPSLTPDLAPGSFWERGGAAPPSRGAGGPSIPDGAGGERDAPAQAGVGVGAAVDPERSVAPPG